ncbi:MAG: FkbM family methyltransferase [Pseudomonadota bacterium]
MPDNLAQIDYCFSPGVDYVAGFEAELSEAHGIKSFMADASVASPPIHNENFNFVPKYLGARTHNQFVTLSDWVKECIGDDDGQRILQMDIEGAEYDVLTYESADALAQFSTIIIELHDLQNIFEPNFFRMLSAIFEKLYKNFSICHVHPNNCGHIAVLNGIEVPSVIELTLLRNDLINRFQSANPVSLPHRLDRSNKPGFPDIAMPEIWWRGD